MVHVTPVELLTIGQLNVQPNNINNLGDNHSIINLDRMVTKVTDTPLSKGDKDPGHSMDNHPTADPPFSTEEKTSKPQLWRAHSWERL